MGGADDDVGDGGRDADLDAGVALLGQLALEELVQLGVEDAIGDELSALRTIKRKKKKNMDVSISRLKVNGGVRQEEQKEQKEQIYL